MIKSFKQYIFESPDEYDFMYNGKEYHAKYEDMTASAFGIFYDKLYNKPRGTHYELVLEVIGDINNGVIKKDKNLLKYIISIYNKKDTKKKFDKLRIRSAVLDTLIKLKKNINDSGSWETLLSYLESIERELFEFPGRYWNDEKVISFWKYPKNVKDFNTIISKLQKVNSLMKDTEDWVIDMGKEASDLSKTLSGEEKKKGVDFDKTIEHVKPGMKKLMGKKPKGYGSDLQRKMAKKAGFNSVAQWNAFRQQETVTIKDYKEYIEE